MTDSLAGAEPTDDAAAAAPKPVGQIQTDTFCEGCGYNLYTQAVVRDARLGLLVCRCPECARYAVPGRATDAGRPWLQRIGAALLLLYLLFLLYMIGLGVAGLAAVHYEHLEDVGRPSIVESRMRAGNRYVYHRGPSFEEQWIPFALSAGVGYGLGSFFAIFFCHWKRPRVWLSAVLPAAVAIIVHVVWVKSSWGLSAEAAAAGRRTSFEHVAVQLAGLGLALLIARPITRGFLRLMLARHLLTYFSSLWIADGMVPPAPAVKETLENQSRGSQASRPRGELGTSSP